MEKSSPVEPDYGSSDLAQEFTTILGGAKIDYQLMADNLLTTLGADLSDIWDAARKVQEYLEKVGLTTDRKVQSDILGEGIESRFGVELVWHAHQVSVKNGAIQASAGRGGKDSKYLIPDEILKEGEELGARAFLAVEHNLQVFGTDSAIKEEVREAFGVVARLAVSSQHIVSCLYAIKDGDRIKYLELLQALSDTMDRVISAREFEIEILGDLMWQLDPESDEGDGADEGDAREVLA